MAVNTGKPAYDDPTKLSNSITMAVPGLAIGTEAVPVGQLFVENLVVSGETTSSVAVGLTAAGTNLATALQLTSSTNVVGTTAASTGVRMPLVPIGGSFYINNSGASTLNVFPPTADSTINGGTAGAAVTLATTKSGTGIRTGDLTYVWNAYP